MNTQLQVIEREELAKQKFARHDRARLAAELSTERQKTKNAIDQLVYSKRFYRILVGILLVLMCVMYGGLWYAKNILSNGCM